MALSYYSKSLAIMQQVLGENHKDTAATYNNIGLIYLDQCDYDLALKYHSKALAIRQQVLGEKHPDTAMSYNNIGLAYDCKGDFGIALGYYNTALAILEQTLPNHPYISTIKNNITDCEKDLKSTNNKQ